MCMNCGCGQPDDAHGNDANITADDLRRAAETNGQSLAETIENIANAGRQLEDQGVSPISGGSPTH